MLPKNCKTAKIIFIPKPGKDLKIPQSFYPIAFLSPMSKIYEPILFQHLYKLNFGVHVEKIRKKATRIRGILYSIINRKSSVPHIVKFRLIKMYVVSALTYTDAEWTHFITKTNFKRLGSVLTIRSTYSDRNINIFKE